MRGIAFATALLAASSGNVVAAREADPLLYSMSDNGRASGKLIDDHTASIYGVVSGAHPDSLSAIAMYKAASLSSTSGYERFAIVKSKVTTSYMNFIPIVQTVRLMVVFLHTGETTASQDGRPVIYVNNLEATDRLKAIIALYHPAKQ